MDNNMNILYLCQQLDRIESERFNDAPYAPYAPFVDEPAGRLGQWHEFQEECGFIESGFIETGNNRAMRGYEITNEDKFLIACLKYL